MKMVMFSAHPTDRRTFEAANALLPETERQAWEFHETRLAAETAKLAHGAGGVCAFPNDTLDRACLERLRDLDVRFVALRSAGFNNVDLDAARACGVCVSRVPAYSPHAVAEHAVALMLALNRKLVRSFLRVRDGNFALEGLLGFDMHGKTVGVVGTGRIGVCAARICAGFGCRILLQDPRVNPEAAELGEYVPLARLMAESDIVTLHCPLTPESKHLVNRATIAGMKKGVMIVNTGRGALVDAEAAIEGLRSGQIGYLGLDVYEEEEEMFFVDHSDRGIDDEVFARLITWPNVLVTAHQAYFTDTALENIARTTLENAAAFARGEPRNTVT